MKFNYYPILVFWLLSFQALAQNLAEMGYEKIIQPRGIHNTVVFKDVRVGGEIVINYLAYPPYLESILTYDKQGLLLDRREFARDTIMLWSGASKTVIRPGDKAGEYNIERRLTKSGKQWDKKSITGIYNRPATLEEFRSMGEDEAVVVNSESQYLACVRPNPPGEWENLLQDVSWLSFTSGGGGRQNNTVFSDSCSGYSGGRSKAMQDMQDSLRIGLSCMNRIGGKAREEAARMLALFQPEFGPPVTFVCDNANNVSGPQANANGRALPAVFAGGPAIIITNPPSAPSKYRNPVNRSLIFHEMLHLLGHAHSISEDFSELAQACCFSEPDEEARELLDGIACRALRIADSRNPEYSRLYAQFNHRYGVLDRYSYGSTMATMEEMLLGASGPDRGNPDLSIVTEMGLGMFEQPSEGKTRAEEADYGGYFDFGPFMGLALASATLEYGPENQRQDRQSRLDKLVDDYYPLVGNRSIRQGINLVTEIFQNAMSGNAGTVAELSRRHERQLRHFCQEAQNPRLLGQLKRVKDGLQRILNSQGKNQEAAELNRVLCSSVESISDHQN